MLERFFERPLEAGGSLQGQIQGRIVEAILAGALSGHEPLPATRILARLLKVSRNTVTLVYERLAEDGYLKAVERRGFFVAERHMRQQPDPRPGDGAGASRVGSTTPVDHAARFRIRPSAISSIEKPKDWRAFPYPFVYGQVETDPATVGRWRDCLRQASSARHVEAWTGDLVDADDPLLVEQIIRRMLPRRGFRAAADEILVTIGAQNALYLVAALYCGAGTVVGIEDPGYVDARNIFLSFGADLRSLPVDAEGVRVTPALAECSLVYVTPSHQSPTSVTLSTQRRLQLMEAAERSDVIVVEDDYEHELNFVGPQHHAVKGLDRSGRVIHIGSLTKPLFPGLRLGFLVAPAPVVRELRALRRLLMRHPSALDQRAMAIFLAEGHYDSHIRRQRDRLATRWKTILGEIVHRLPNCRATMTTGGSALWLKLPTGVEPLLLQAEAARRGVLVEAGDVHFREPDPARNHIRLGFAAIGTERIGPGIARLAEALAAVRAY